MPYRPRTGLVQPRNGQMFKQLWRVFCENNVHQWPNGRALWDTGVKFEIYLRAFGLQRFVHTHTQICGATVMGRIFPGEDRTVD